eukprot:TRINITY_DN1638_c0_g1_i1.p1 TRINITY_DN1638_c0_g1~~TRINITY_DN1638_c0_g1_i1.p1  ORF type:complete len:353 (-),score=112.06 TRINITY_DN1638_c0_g1_i1:502-1560(-)
MEQKQLEKSEENEGNQRLQSFESQNEGNPTLQSNSGSFSLGKRKGEEEMKNERGKFQNWQVPPPSLFGRNFVSSMSNPHEIRSLFDWNRQPTSLEGENFSSLSTLSRADYNFACMGLKEGGMTPPTDFTKLFDNSVPRTRRGSLQSDLKFAVSSTQGKRKTQEDTFDVGDFASKRDTPESSPRLEGSSEGEREEDSILAGVHNTGENEQAITQIEEKADYAFFAVYDGHGGNQAAEFTAKTMQKTIVNHPNFSKDTKTAIMEGFKETESAFEKLSKENKIHGGVGTTACVAIINGNTLYVANVGDSAAILCRRGQPLMLTVPHTPKTESERERVLAAGGVVKVCILTIHFFL